MTEKVAIVGSREGADLEHVVGFVTALRDKHPDTTLVSGGANGVDVTAEKAWLDLGGQVTSLRPVKTGPDEWSIERWELGGDNPRVFPLIHEPSFADYGSAALYRDILIVEEADRVVAFFKPGRSRGTAHTVEMAGYRKLPIHEYVRGAA